MLNNGDQSLIATKCVEVVVCSLVSVIAVWRIWKGGVVRRRVCLRVIMPSRMHRTGGGCHGSRELRLLIWLDSWMGEAGTGRSRHANGSRNRAAGTRA